MSPTRSLMLLLFTGSMASAACIVEKIDTDNEGGSGGTTATTGGGGTGGTAEGGGNEGGNAEGGAGGMAEGGGGTGGEGPSCFELCDETHANGVADYEAYYTCVTCSACYDVCDGGTGDVCASGSEDVANCSSGQPDCQSCINSSCASDVDGNGQTSGVCGTELGTFLNNPDALDLNDCYNGCGS